MVDLTAVKIDFVIFNGSKSIVGLALCKTLNETVLKFY